MRRLFLPLLLGLVLSLSTGLASAATTRTFHGTFASGGVHGTVTVTLNGTSSGKLTEVLGGLHPRTMSVLWLRSGSCAVTGSGIVRVRWTVNGTGHVRTTVSLTSSMATAFLHDWTHHGGVHARLTDGSINVCTRLQRG